MSTLLQADRTSAPYLWLSRAIVRADVSSMCLDELQEYMADRKRLASSSEHSPKGTVTTFLAEAPDKGPPSIMPANTGIQRANICECACSSSPSSSLSRISQLFGRPGGPSERYGRPMLIVTQCQDIRSPVHGSASSVKKSKPPIKGRANHKPWTSIFWHTETPCHHDCSHEPPCYTSGISRQIKPLCVLHCVTRCQASQYDGLLTETTIQRRLERIMYDPFVQKIADACYN